MRLKAFYLSAIIIAAASFFLNAHASAQITGTFPYPKWFLSLAISSPNELKFRMYGYEGIARNLFILTCKKDRNVLVRVEVIPPKSVEEILRNSASAKSKPTSIDFLRKDGSVIFNSSLGEYDKIAAFMYLTSEKQLFDFLQLFMNDYFLVRWNQAKIEYFFENNNDISINLFRTNFRSKLLQEPSEELSYQDVFIRCSGMWGK